jgi:hypothetical protein
MANNFITTDLVAKNSLAMFANNAPFVMTASRIYEDEFMNTGYKVGDNIRIRRQNRFIVGDGSTATPQDIIEDVENLTIDHQYHTMIAYTVKDLTLRIDDFNRMFIQPAIQEIITEMEKDIGQQAETSLNYFTGSTSSRLNSFESVDLAGAKLLEQGVNLADNAYLAASVRDGSVLKGALLNQFTPAYNDEIVKTSSLGHLSYFDVFQSQNIVSHVAGVGPRTRIGTDTLVVGSVGSNGTVLGISGAQANITNYFVAGDVISIGGVKSVNPIGRASTGQDMQFVVTQNANSDNAGILQVFISPQIISDVNNPRRNVSNPVPANAPVTMYNSHNVNVAYTRRSLDIVCPPLYKLQVPYVSVATDPETGLSLAVTQQGDMTTYQNYMRIDVLCGFKWHPEYAVRVLSQL